jgi:predicted aspartyl protease
MRFPYVQVRVRLGNLQYPSYEFDLEALVDTGFDGGLMVPQSLVPDWVPISHEATCDLADGSSVIARAYRGFVSIGSFQPVGTIVIALPHQALLGRAVTNHFRLSFLYGRQVVIEH